MIIMCSIRVLIPAAGRGSRSGLAYPKTLFPINGSPILHRLLEVLCPYDNEPTIIVSPQGELLIRSSLQQVAPNAHLVLQPEPKGMGDAVLRFDLSPTAVDADHILLAWGDLAYLQADTVSRLIISHYSAENDFTFITRVVEKAYTSVLRNNAGKVLSVSETREQCLSDPAPGERDIGLFVFRKDLIFSFLKKFLPGRTSKITHEHGFLYVIEHLVRDGGRVEALPIASEYDIVSFNSPADLDFIEPLGSYQK